MKNTIRFLACCFLLFSCKKEPVPPLQKSSGVYIVNEGNFNFGNGEISFFNPASGQTDNNLFSVTNSYSLGDVVQSMYLKDSIGFIVVNNSRKIEVVSIPSFAKIRTITIPGSSPRYLLPINDSMAYVTDIYANKVHVINYVKGELVTQVAVPQYSEHLVMVDEIVFVEGKRILSNAASKGALMRINTSNHTYMDRVEFNGDAGGLVSDKNNRIWIAIDENQALSFTASLKCFDKQLNMVEEYSFPAFGHRPRGLCIDGSGTKLYYIDGNVYSFPLTPTNREPTLFCLAEQRNYYGLGVDPFRNEVYVSDALDYVQPSRVYRYDGNGELLRNFTAGIISNNFVFTND